MTREELKILQMSGQHLLRPADKLTVARDLCGVQAQFLTNALHAMKIRSHNYEEASLGDGLVKNWTVRGTVHVFREEDIPLFLCFENAGRYRSRDWTLPSFWNQRSDWALTPARQGELSERILAAIQERAHTREELKRICRESGMSEAEEGSMFHPWGGGIRELCERGFMHCLVQEEKTYCMTREFDPVPQEEAQLELARRFFTHFAPATIHDAMYFFRTTAAQVKKWLNRLPVNSAECGGKTYYYIDRKADPLTEFPRCVFLAGFDQLMLGYEKKESLYLPTEHMRKIFNLAGIVMPAVLLDGMVVGRWKKKGRVLTVELFSPLGDGEKAVVGDAAELIWSKETVEIRFKD